MFRIREYFKDEEKGDHYLLKELGASFMRMGGGVNLLKKGKEYFVALTGNGFSTFNTLGAKLNRGSLRCFLGGGGGRGGGAILVQEIGDGVYFIGGHRVTGRGRITLPPGRSFLSKYGGLSQGRGVGGGG